MWLEHTNLLTFALLFSAPVSVTCNVLNYCQGSESWQIVFENPAPEVSTAFEKITRDSQRVASRAIVAACVNVKGCLWVGDNSLRSGRDGWSLQVDLSEGSGCRLTGSWPTPCSRDEFRLQARRNCRTPCSSLQSTYWFVMPREELFAHNVFMWSWHRCAGWSLTQKVAAMRPFLSSTTCLRSNYSLRSCSFVLKLITHIKQESTFRPIDVINLTWTW